MDQKHEKRSAAYGGIDIGELGTAAMPLLLKIKTERQFADMKAPRAANMAAVPSGICLDYEAMEEDESGEDAPVLFDAYTGENAEAEPPHSQSELVTGGELKRDGDSIVLSWREFDGWNMTIMSIAFDPADPATVSLGRQEVTPFAVVMEALSGKRQPELCLVLERGRRHICLLDTQGDLREVAVRTFKLENSLLRRGAMLLDYSVEIHGLRAERTRIQIKAKRAPEE